MAPLQLVEVLERALRDRAPSALCVAFSGGPDSTALLHALAHLPGARARGLRALHVDHGLHADSADWVRHCAAFCRVLDLPLTVIKVEVDDTRREGIEAAARRARYAAFAANLGAGEWLALAHHRDDQVETVLLKLLRGAGPEGLGGMRALRPFAQGSLWRPLLETPRIMLANYLIGHGLVSIDDPANADARYLRNQLRHAVLPHLRAQWPYADAAILHAARLCRAAADYLNDAATAALATLRRDAGSLDVHGWLALPDALRAPVLNTWLNTRGFNAPPDRARAEIQKQATHAAPDKNPLVRWSDTEVHLWNGGLHAMRALPAPPPMWQTAWNGRRVELPSGCGALTLAAPAGGPAPRVPFDPPLTVRLRRGGERLRPAGQAHTRAVGDLFRAARVAPWLRPRCPLIYHGDELIAVADLWQSERGQALFAAWDAQPYWHRPGAQ
ncbi:MAG: tRNA lysidine(34) synthetase TilS [Rhodanobacteraceae bacterium]|nr:MAG: tRNA lysidine(34) synthetase TilS [Rhodanobacteraceae bacterium]